MSVALISGPHQSTDGHRSPLQQLLENQRVYRHGIGDLKLPFSLFLALRYLKPKRTFLSIITLISVLGVMLGVTVLILVISVMTGFDRELRQKVIDFDAHILVSSETGNLNNWRELAEKIRATPHVVATAPFVQGQVIVEHDERRLAPTIRGIDPEQEEKVVSLQKFVKWGKLDLDGDTTVLGVELARELNVRVGDQVTVYSPGNLDEILDRIKKLENAKDVEEVKAQIEKFLEVPQFARTWIDMNHQIFEAIRLERNVMFFLLFFIVVVAAFGIMSTLITVTVQKRREIGIMKALGANIAQIVWVFLGQGMVVGFFGTLTGLGLGMALIRYRNEFSQWLANTLHIEIFPREVYQFSSIPAEVIPRDVTLICLSAFLICSIAALIPAYFAARLDPVKALRFE